MSSTPAGIPNANNSLMATLIRPLTPTVIRPSGAVIAIRPREIIEVRPAVYTVIRPATPVTIAVRPAVVTTVQPVAVETITPPDRGAWEERGWSRRRDRNNDVYEGLYVVGTRRFRGRIEVGRGRRISAYVLNPPREIRRHRHHACFQQFGIGTGWYILHWQRSPRNVDEALLYFEQILDESINGRG